MFGYHKTKTLYVSVDSSHNLVFYAQYYVVHSVSWHREVPKSFNREYRKWSTSENDPHRLFRKWSTYEFLIKIKKERDPHVSFVKKSSKESDPHTI